MGVVVRRKGHGETGKERGSGECCPSQDKSAKNISESRMHEQTMAGVSMTDEGKKINPFAPDNELSRSYALCDLPLTRYLAKRIRSVQ